MLRVFFKYNRKLLSSLCLCARLALLKYLRAATGEELTPGIITAIQSFGSKITFDYLTPYEYYQQWLLNHRNNVSLTH